MRPTRRSGPRSGRGRGAAGQRGGGDDAVALDGEEREDLRIVDVAAPALDQRVAFDGVPGEAAVVERQALEEGVELVDVALGEGAEEDLAAVAEDGFLRVAVRHGGEGYQASARRLIARSHMRRMMSLPGWTTRQEPANRRASFAVFAKTRVSVIRRVPRASGVMRKFIVASTPRLMCVPPTISCASSAR